MDVLVAGGDDDDDEGEVLVHKTHTRNTLRSHWI